MTSIDLNADLGEGSAHEETVMGVVSSANIACGGHAGDERSMTEEAIGTLKIKTDGTEQIISGLSGGNQQKVVIAKSLRTAPRVLLLDEPTQGVDVGAKSEIHKIIRNLAKEGLAVLMISSDLPEVLGMSDRIAVMRGGTLVATLPGGTNAHTVMAAALGKGEAA